MLLFICYKKCSFNSGHKISIYEIDVFWRKLDLTPELVEEDEVDVDTEIYAFREEIMSQPDIVKKSLLSKIKSVIYPKKTDKKPPVVHKETRGRPTKQTQEQRKQNKAKNKPQSTQSQHTTYEDAPRHSYVMESQESIVDSQQSRHNSYIPSVVSSDVKPKT